MAPHSLLSGFVRPRLRAHRSTVVLPPTFFGLMRVELNPFGVAVVLEPKRFMEQSLGVMTLASVVTTLEPSSMAIMAKGQVMWQLLVLKALFEVMLLLLMLVSVIPKAVVLRPVRRAPTTARTR